MKLEGAGVRRERGGGFLTLGVLVLIGGRVEKELEGGMVAFWNNLLGAVTAISMSMTSIGENIDRGQHYEAD